MLRIQKDPQEFFLGYSESDGSFTPLKINPREPNQQQELERVSDLARAAVGSLKLNLEKMSHARVGAGASADHQPPTTTFVQRYSGHGAGGHGGGGRQY